METPRFLFAADEETEQLYIIHTMFPLAVIWIKQTTPVQLFVVECEIDPVEYPDDQQAIEEMLIMAGEFWRRKVEKGFDLN